MDVVVGVATNKLFFVPVAIAALLALFKAIPNNEVQEFIGAIGKGLGTMINHAVGKKSWVKKIWNFAVEPFVIDLIENTFVTFSTELIKELKSDNPKE